MKDGGGSGIRDIDRGMDKIRKEIAALSQLSIKAGIIEGAGSKDGVSIAQYAAYNEFGVPGKKKKWRIPPRPFIRGFVENESAEIKAMQEQLVKLVSEGKMSADTAVKRLGQFAQDGIKRYIMSGNFEPNAEATIQRKGSSRPLIDTGTMRNSVRYQVKKKGGQ
jgi:hypothetical protein